MTCHRDNQLRMIITLKPHELQTACPLHEQVKCFQKKKEYDKPYCKLDAAGLEAREQFFENVDRLVEIYQPYFQKLRRQQSSKKGEKYFESLENMKMHC